MSYIYIYIWSAAMRKDDAGDLNQTFIFDLAMQLLKHTSVTVWINYVKA